MENICARARKSYEEEFSLESQADMREEDVYLRTICLIPLELMLK